MPSGGGGRLGGGCFFRLMLTGLTGQSSSVSGLWSGVGGRGLSEYVSVNQKI